jgi:hypothetical protein
VAHSRTFPSTPIAVLALTAAMGHLAAVVGASGLSDAGNWASIAAAAFAFLILAAGFARWLSIRVAKRHAARPSRVEYGQLDYVPEFGNATDRYTEAQAQITEATSRSTAVNEKNQDLTSQPQADECAKAAHELSEAYEALLPEMRRDAQIMTDCLRGILSAMPPRTKGDWRALTELQLSTKDARESSSGYVHAMRGARRSVVGLRKRNVAASLNESATRLEGQLDDAARTVRRVVRRFRAIEVRIAVRLFLHSLSPREAPDD